MFCYDDFSLAIYSTLHFGLFSSEVPVLIYYSHVTAIVVTLLVSLFVFLKNRNSLPAKILLAISLAFSALAVIDIFLWTQIDSRLLMFLWSFWLTLFILIFGLSLYFLYSFIKKKDLPFSYKILSVITLLAIEFLSTYFYFENFDVTYCNATETIYMINGVFALGFLIFISTVIFGFVQIRKIPDQNEQKKALYATIGISLFLLIFSTATYIASILDIFFIDDENVFQLEQYGYFGMTIFIGFLAYTIVQYKAFNIKLIATQALTSALVILVASQFLYVRNFNSRILTGITLALALGFGYYLVRSVKKEIAAREALAVANQRQKNLIHSMNHQIKGRFLNNRIVFDELLNNAKYSAFPEPVKKMLAQGYDDSTRALEYVKGILMGASAESGQLPFTMKPMNFKELVEKVIADQKEKIEQKGLTLVTHIEEGSCDIVGDTTQLSEAVRNLIENARHYNAPNGSITVTLTCANRAAHLEVKDSGIGIAEEDKSRIFSSGGRGKDSTKYNTDSSGYGLAFVKAVTEAHGGKVWFTSNVGEQGTTFHVEIPVQQS